MGPPVVSALHTCDLVDGVPRPRRQVLPERLLDERHEYRPLGTGNVGTEDFPSLHEKNARAVLVDWQRGLRSRLVAQEGDNTLRGATEAKGAIRIGCDQLAKRVDRAHDCEECSPDVLPHRRFGLTLQGRLRRGAGAERDVTARADGLHVREAGGFEGPLQRSAIRVHRADGAKKGGVARHEWKLAGWRSYRPRNRCCWKLATQATAATPSDCRPLTRATGIAEPG